MRKMQRGRKEYGQNMEKKGEKKKNKESGRNEFYIVHD